MYSDSYYDHRLKNETSNTKTKFTRKISPEFLPSLLLVLLHLERQYHPFHQQVQEVLPFQGNLVNLEYQVGQLVLVTPEIIMYSIIYNMQ